MSSTVRVERPREDSNALRLCRSRARAARGATHLAGSGRAALSQSARSCGEASRSRTPAGPRGRGDRFRVGAPSRRAGTPRGAASIASRQRSALAPPRNRRPRPRPPADDCEHRSRSRTKRRTECANLRTPVVHPRAQRSARPAPARSFARALPSPRARTEDRSWSEEATPASRHVAEDAGCATTGTCANGFCVRRRGRACGVGGVDFESGREGATPIDAERYARG